jgi:hypothetical protein
MDKKTIAEAARMSKRVCNEEGTGNHVIIWTKGYTKEIVEDVLGSDRPWLKTPEGGSHLSRAANSISHDRARNRGASGGTRGGDLKEGCRRGLFDFADRLDFHLSKRSFLRRLSGANWGIL